MDSSWRSGASVIEPLLTIEREDLTGILEFRAQNITTKIYAREGEIVFAEGGTIGETLGRLLLRAERLTEEHVVAIIRRMTDALIDDNEHLRFGEVIQEAGFMTSDELDLALVQQVREKICGCIHRGSGEYRFAKDDPHVDDVGSFVVGARPTIVEAAIYLPERRIEDVLHLDEQRYPEIVAPEKVLAQEFELTRTEAAVLRDLDGTSSLHFILSTTKTPNVAALIAALVMGGGVELRTTPTGTRQDSESRVVPPEFRTQRRERAVRKEDRTMQMAAAPVKPPPQSQPSHPPPKSGSTLPPVSTPPKRKSTTPDPPESAPPPPPSHRKRPPSHSSPTMTVARAFPQKRESSRESLTAASPDAEARAKRALYELKSDLEARKPVSSRRRWPEPRDGRERRLMAETAFHRGRLYLRAEDAERGLPGLHRALELRPEEREYELYVKWAQMLVNDSFKDDAERETIRALASRIVRESRDCELGFSILGHCTMHDGHDEAALRFFRRASQLDPKLVDAARLKRLLTNRSSEDAVRKAAASKSDRAPGRSRLRGMIPTPLDEIVPAQIQTAADMTVPRIISRPSLPAVTGGSSPSITAASTYSSLIGNNDATTSEISPPVHHSNRPNTAAVSETGPFTARLVTPMATPAPPHISEIPLLLPQPSTSPMSVSPMTPRAYPPPPSTPPLPDMVRTSFTGPPPPLLVGATGQSPSAAPPSSSPNTATKAISPWRLPTSNVSGPPPPVTNTAATSIPPVAPSSSPSMAPPIAASSVVSAPRPVRSAAFSIPEPTPPPTKKSKAGVIAIWLVSLSLVSIAAYVLGIRDAHDPSAVGDAKDPKSMSSSDLPSSGSAIVETTSTTTAVAATMTASTSSASSSPSAKASASAGAGGATGTIHTRKSYGRRIFVDGHIVGEGGRDYIVPCGPRRIKVGSAGTEHIVTIPCGSAIDVD